MIKKAGVFLLIAAVTLSACAAPMLSSSSRTENDVYGDASGASGAPPPAATMAMAYEAEAPADEAVKTTTTERLVIKNANLSLVVKDPEASVNAIAGLAEGAGGFVVSSNVFRASADSAGNTIKRATISVRVPADQLQATLTEIKEMAVTVNNETVSGEDVTAQFTDLQSRLRNLEAAEAQLQKIMDGATKTEDVLAVYNQLVYIREQIEQVKGQMQFYRESAAMSFIGVELIPDALSQPIEVGGWRPQGVLKDAVEALVRAFQGLATAGIWLAVYCAPLALVFGVPAFFVVRLAVRRFRRPKPETPKAE